MQNSSEIKQLTIIISRRSDVARDTETKIKHVDSKNTRVVLPQPPNCNPKATEFEVKIQFSQNSILNFTLALATHK
ncbi:hypothetical protein Hanom_Chr04g00314411 [Helianthus anomalus]